MTEIPNQVVILCEDCSIEHGSHGLQTIATVTWLPEFKRAAVCFSVDDVHPATSADPYEAGGDLADGALGRVERLLERHPDLQATLFVTPDWRPIQLVRSRWLAGLPLLRNVLHHVDRHPDGHFRVDRHPAFVRYLNSLPRTEVALHGLHHSHRGSRLAVEFQEQARDVCVQTLRKGLSIFDAAGLRHCSGFAPPGWNLPDSLIAALDELGFDYVVSARDIRSRVTPSATCDMSGLKGVSLLHPQRVGRSRLVHLPVNFQATSSFERAERIIEHHGVLSIKAHIFKHGGGHTLKDGLDDAYVDYLDRLLKHLERRYGESLWWPTMTELAQHFDRRADTPAELSNFGDWIASPA